MTDLKFKMTPKAFDVSLGAGTRIDVVVKAAQSVVVGSHRNGEDTWKLSMAPAELADDKEKVMGLYRALQAHCLARGWLQQSPKATKRNPVKIKTQSVTVPAEAIGELNAAMTSHQPNAMEALRRKYPQGNPG